MLLIQNVSVQNFSMSICCYMKKKKKKKEQEKNFQVRSNHCSYLSPGLGEGRKIGELWLCRNKIWGIWGGGGGGGGGGGVVSQ